MAQLNLYDVCIQASIVTDFEIEATSKEDAEKKAEAQLSIECAFIKIHSVTATELTEEERNG